MGDRLEILGSVLRRTGSRLEKALGIFVFTSSAIILNSEISEHNRIKNDYLARQTTITSEVRKDAESYATHVTDHSQIGNLYTLFLTWVGASLIYSEKKKENK